jgi:hypothetical protein
MLRMFVGELSSGGGGKKILDVCLPTKIVLDKTWEVVDGLKLRERLQNRSIVESRVST